MASGGVFELVRCARIRIARNALIRLLQVCGAQSYDWGKLGKVSSLQHRVAQRRTDGREMIAERVQGLRIRAGVAQLPLRSREALRRGSCVTLYAVRRAEESEMTQLWMGTHPSCPSTLLSTGQSLKEYLVQHPQLLGDKVVQKFGKDLPFLFKVRSFVAIARVVLIVGGQVLAIRKALSIQAHPDKKLAQQLHADHPEIYKGISILLPRRLIADSVIPRSESQGTTRRSTHRDTV